MLKITKRLEQTQQDKSRFDLMTSLKEDIEYDEQIEKKTMSIIENDYAIDLDDFSIISKKKKKQVSQRKPILDAKQFDKILSISSTKSGLLSSCVNFMRLIKHLRLQSVSQTKQTEKMLESSFKSGHLKKM